MKVATLKMNFPVFSEVARSFPGDYLKHWCFLEVLPKTNRPSIIVIHHLLLPTFISYKMANAIRRIFGSQSRGVRYTQSSSQTTPDNQDRAESLTNKYTQSSSQTAADNQDPPEYAMAVQAGDSECAVATEARDCEKSPSLDKLTADKKKQPGLSENQGRCDCSQHDSCCLKHHSLRYPSASTLAPVHSLMAYHLSFEHLSCIRRKLGDKMQKTKHIPELSWEDEVNSTHGVDYEMLSEVYTCKGEFLQRQQIRLSYGSGDSSPNGEQFFGCPHQSVRVSSPVRKKTSNLIDVQVDISHNPPPLYSLARVTEADQIRTLIYTNMFTR